MSLVPSESEEQKVVFEWAAWNETKYPELKLLFHIPNGGLRSKGTAVRLKAEGVKAGVPDLLLPVRRNEFGGLWIEMKKADHSNKPTENQKEWLTALAEQGYSVMVAYGADEAINGIVKYLESGVEEKNDKQK